MTTEQRKIILILALYAISTLIGVAFGYVCAFELYTQKNIFLMIVGVGAYLIALDSFRAEWLKLDEPTIKLPLVAEETPSV